MDYKTLEAFTRRAACNTLGRGSNDFDRHLATCSYNEGAEIGGFDLGPSVELYIDPSVLPLPYFSSNIAFYVTASGKDKGDVQAFFGDICRNTAAAKAAAGDFLYRCPSDGWYVADDIHESLGLHLMREFNFDPHDERDLFSKLNGCFIELCKTDMADKLRSFIHYFEN